MFRFALNLAAAVLVAIMLVVLMTEWILDAPLGYYDPDRGCIAVEVDGKSVDCADAPRHERIVVPPGMSRAKIDAIIEAQQRR